VKPFRSAIAQSNDDEETLQTAEMLKTECKQSEDLERKTSQKCLC